MSRLQNTAKFVPMVIHAFRTAGLNPALGCALAAHESDWDPNAKVLTGPDGHLGGARGLFQMTLSTARDLGFAGDPSELFDPQLNTDLAVKLALRNAAVIGSTSPALLAAAHNCGAGHVVNHTIPRSTQNNYVPTILRLMMLYGPKIPDEVVLDSGPVEEEEMASELIA
jgi:soluble lytic murein transglycosylase-like protein